MSNTPLEDLLTKLSSGDMAAAEQVFLEYEPYLRMVVRRMLPSFLRRKFDSVDVVHSLWADLLGGFQGENWQFKDVKHLRAFLIRSTRNRFLDRARKHQHHGVDQEIEPVDLQEHVVAPDPRPSEIAQANDLWERMLALCPEAHRPLLRLKRQGLTMGEIAKRTGYHPSSVRRVFYDLARQLAEK